jgi:tRNA modification GTPase
VPSFDTLVAIATARGAAERGVIRLAGPRAFEMVGARFDADDGGAGVEALRAAVASRSAAALRGRFSLRGTEAARRAPGWADAASAVDLWLFRAPRSYTGDDLVELHLPGAPALLDLAVRLLVADGARPAEPGEFTRRAAEAGKLDLTRAEAILATISARDADEHRRARALLDGGLAREVAARIDRVIELLVPLELALDFSDQDVEIVAPERHAADLRALAVALRVASTPVRGAARRTLRRVVLRGPANAGKSTLFNALLGRDVALAAPVAGTTRDVLVGLWERGGASAMLTDTAGDDVHGGMHDAAAHAARERALLEADLVLEVRDLRRGGWPARRPAEGPPFLCVGTFADLTASASPAESGTRAPTGYAVHRVAAPYEIGVRELADALARALADAASESAADAAPFLVTARVAGLFGAAAEAVARAAEALETSPVECAASDLRAALRALRAIVFAEGTDPVLDRIFRDFCIGK